LDLDGSARTHKKQKIDDYETGLHLSIARTSPTRAERIAAHRCKGVCWTADASFAMVLDRSQKTRRAGRLHLPWRTPLQTAGASPYEVGLILNHSGSGVTSQYSHGVPVELKLKLMEKWADHVASLVQPEGVTPLR
jgi:hypothetical protein